MVMQNEFSCLNLIVESSHEFFIGFCLIFLLLSETWYLVVEGQLRCISLLQVAFY